MHIRLADILFDKQIATRLTVAKRVVGNTTDEEGSLESRSDSPVIAPLNRNTAAICSHPAPPLSLSLWLLLSFFIRERESERELSFSLSPFLFLVRRLERTPSVNLDANASLSGLQIESGLATCLS